MDFRSSPSVFYIDEDRDDDHRQYFDGSRNFSHQMSTSYEMISRAEKKRKLTNQHQPNPMLVPHGQQGPKRPRNHPFDQGRLERSHSIQSGTEFEPILLDPEEYIIEQPETSHSFHAFDWTIDQRRAPTTINPVHPRKAAPAPLLPPPVLPMQNLNMIDLRTTPNLSRNSIDRNELRRRSSPMEQPLSQQQQQQQQRRLLPIPAGLPPTAAMPLPLPKPTATLPRTPAKRGRPSKIGRTPRSLETSPTTPVVRPASDSSIASTGIRPIAANPSVVHPHAEIRRQTLNGMGIFSAFHDTKYYRCNICKFKSVTSSTLLQHLFTHLFFCQHCSYYTFSNYQLAQHLFDRHQINFLEEIGQPSNPALFDLLYLTRCADGTFALCMDGSTSPATPTTPTQNVSQPSSSSFNQSKSIPTKKRKIIRPEEPIVPVVEPKQPVEHVEIVEKKATKFVLMKTRSFYSLRKPICLHSLTLEYGICRKEMLKKKFQCLTLTQRTDQPRRLTDEIAHCIRTIVNEIDENEENFRSSAVCVLPEQILSSILPNVDLKELTEALKLKPKSKKIIEKPMENSMENHVFVVGLAESIDDENLIRLALHSNTTNGEMPYTQTKLPKLSLNFDNTFRFFRKNRIRSSTKKSVTKPKSPSPPELCPPTTVMSNSTTNRVDRNNNSITSSQSKSLSNSSPTDSPLVIVLD